MYTDGEVEQLMPTQGGLGRAEHKPLHVVITAGQGRGCRQGWRGRSLPGTVGNPVLPLQASVQGASLLPQPDLS